MRYLFVCSAGEHRSVAAVRVATQLAEQRGLNDYTFDSLGISKTKKQSIRKIVSQYDKVFVMEQWMRNQIRKATSNTVIAINFNIHDNYVKPSDNKHLERRLENRLQKYI